MNDQQTKQLVIAGRTSKVEWTREDAIKAFGQGWGLFTEHNKVMRVLRVMRNSPPEGPREWG